MNLMLIALWIAVVLLIIALVELFDKLDDMRAHMKRVDDELSSLHRERRRG